MSAAFEKQLLPTCVAHQHIQPGPPCSNLLRTLPHGRQARQVTPNMADGWCSIAAAAAAAGCGLQAFACCLGPAVIPVCKTVVTRAVGPLQQMLTRATDIGTSHWLQYSG
jgi:hypothetical protein